MPQATSGKALTIDGLVHVYVSDHHVPGLSIAVIAGGKVILAQGYGFADLENHVPATLARKIYDATASQ